MDTHLRAAGGRCSGRGCGCGAGTRRMGSGPSASREPLIDGCDLLLENRSDLFWRIQAQKLLKTLLAERQLAAAHGGGRTEEQSLAGVGIESERLLDKAPRASIQLVL